MAVQIQEELRRISVLIQFIVRMLKRLRKEKKRVL